MTKLQAMCLHVANILTERGWPCDAEELEDAIFAYENATGYLVAIHTKQRNEQPHD